MKLAVIGALLLVACGGSAGPGEVEMAVVVEDGGAVTADADGGAVAETGSSPSCPLAENGFTSYVVTSVTNACGASPIAGYVVCCSTNGMDTTVGKTLIPGGPADPCVPAGAALPKGDLPPGQTCRAQTLPSTPCTGSTFSAGTTLCCCD